MKTYCKPFRRGASWRSQNYGASPGGYNPPSGHTGTDDAAPVGTPIHAAGDGVIEFIGRLDTTYHDNILWLTDFGGNVVILNCGDDEPTFIYAHVDKFHVKQGQRVTKGQVIADCGNTGTATTGSHCHTECLPPGYTLNSPTLGRVNPDRYLAEYVDDLKEDYDMLSPEQMHELKVWVQTCVNKAIDENWKNDGITHDALTKLGEKVDKIIAS